MPPRKRVTPALPCPNAETCDPSRVESYGAARGDGSPVKVVRCNGCGAQEVSDETTPERS